MSLERGCVDPIECVDRRVALKGRGAREGAGDEVEEVARPVADGRERPAGLDRWERRAGLNRRLSQDRQNLELGVDSAVREGSPQALGCVARVELRGEQSEVPCGESESDIAREMRSEVRCQPSDWELVRLSYQKSDKLASALPK